MNFFVEKRINFFISMIITGLFSIFLAFKTFYFVKELGLHPHKKLILTASFGIALCLTSICNLTKQRAGFITPFLLYLFLTILLYADAVYERYYGAILNIRLFGQVGQLNDVADSIVSLFYPTDFWYFLDLPLIAVVLYFIFKKFSDLRNKALGISVLTVGVTAILFTSFYPLKESFSDQYKVSLTGIVPAHIFDTANLLKEQLTQKELTTEEMAILDIYRQHFLDNQELQRLSPYFGKFSGKNIIMIQAESLNDFPIGEIYDGVEATPNLNALMEVSNYYPNIYLQIGRGNTSDAEFVANNSLYPMADTGIYKTYPKNDYLSLAAVLKEEGYATHAAHGNKPEFWNRKMAYPKQGFELFYHSEHVKINRDEIIGMGISDRSMLDQLVEIYKQEKEPFYSFFISLTTHRPFVMPPEYEYLQLPDELIGTMTGNYLQSVRYFDAAVGHFIDRLKEENLWDNTIFIIYGDHYGPIPKDAAEIEKLIGVDFNEKEQFNIPLIIHHPGQTAGTVIDKVGSQMDIYPTITSLLGMERPLIQLGKPLDIEGHGSVGFMYETTKNSFYSDDFDYIAAHNGKFESGQCISNETNQETPLDNCRTIYEKVKKEVEISRFLLENNLINKLFTE